MPTRFRLLVLLLLLTGCRVDDADSARTILRRVLVDGSWSRFSETFDRGQRRPVDFTSLGLVIYDKSRIGSLWSVPEPDAVEMSAFREEPRLYRWFEPQRLLAYCHPGFPRPFLIAPDSVSYERALQLAEDAGVRECDPWAVLSIAGARIEERADSGPRWVSVDLRGALLTWPIRGAIRNLGNVRRIDLSCSELTDSDLEGVLSFPGLEELSLSSTLVTDSGLLRLSTMHNLREIELGGTRTTQAGRDELKRRLGGVLIETQGRDC